MKIGDCSTVLLGKDVKFQIELIHPITGEAETILLDDSGVRTIIGFAIPHLSENKDPFAERLHQLMFDMTLEAWEDESERHSP